MFRYVPVPESFTKDSFLKEIDSPCIDGQTLSVWLKGDPALANIPIIVLTAWPEEVAQHTVQAYNLNGYLCKPFNTRDLLQIIDKALGTKAL